MVIEFVAFEVFVIGGLCLLLSSVRSCKTLRFFLSSILIFLGSAIDHWVIFPLLPAVALGALHPIRTPGFINRLDILVLLPVRALDMLVMMFLRVSSVILDIMRVHTLRTIVIGSYGAPYSLIRVEVELKILGPLVDELNGDLVFVMGKRADFPVGAQ